MKWFIWLCDLSFLKGSYYVIFQWYYLCYRIIYLVHNVSCSLSMILQKLCRKNLIFDDEPRSLTGIVTCSATISVSTFSQMLFNECWRDNDGPDGRSTPGHIYHPTIPHFTTRIHPSPLYTQPWITCSSLYAAFLLGFVNDMRWIRLTVTLEQRTKEVWDSRFTDKDVRWQSSCIWYCQIGGTKMILARGKGRLVREVQQQHDSEDLWILCEIEPFFSSLSCFFLCQLLGSTDA